MPVIPQQADEVAKPQSLDSFVAEMHADIDKFAAAYRAKAAENPEHYPLEMPVANAGLWYEFFSGFVESGEA